MLDVGQANEFKLACRRAGYTNADIKKMCEGDTLAQFLPVLKGHANIVKVKHIVDLDADPFVPNGWRVEEHISGGKFDLDLAKIALYLDEEQQNGGVIVGNELRKKLKGRSALNANVLDHLLVNPSLIPEGWKGQLVFFWGTIYRSSGGFLCVRCLLWSGDKWRWVCYWLDSSFYDRCPCAALASSS